MWLQDIANIEIGRGVTKIHPQDRVPYVVVAKTATTLKVVLVDDRNLQPEGQHNGFPVFDHVFTPEELQARKRADWPPETLRRNNRGRWQFSGGTPASVLCARYRRDYSEGLRPCAPTLQDA